MTERPMPETTRRLYLATRIDAHARRTIERIAHARRITPSQVARLIIEEWVRNLDNETRAA